MRLSVIEHTQCCISLCSWALKGEIQLFFINLFINDEGMRVFCAMQCNQSGQNEKGKCRRQYLNRNTDSLLGELLVGAKENVSWSPGQMALPFSCLPLTPITLLVPQLLPGQWLKRDKWEGK